MKIYVIGRKYWQYLRKMLTQKNTIKINNCTNQPMDLKASLTKYSLGKKQKFLLC